MCCRVQRTAGGFARGGMGKTGTHNAADTV